MTQTSFPGMDVRLEGHSPDLTLRYRNIGQYNEDFYLGWVVSAVSIYLSITAPFQGLDTLVMEELPVYVRESLQYPAIVVDRS